MLSRAAVTVAAATAAVLTAQSGAEAQPGPAGGAGSSSPDEVRRQVDALYAQAETAGQRAAGAQEQQAALQRRAALLEQRLAEEQQQANDVAAQLGALARSEYEQGGTIDPVVQLLLSAHPADYLDRAAGLGQVDSDVAAHLAELRYDERRVQRDSTAVTEQLDGLERLRHSITTDKADVQRRLGRAQALLGSLTANQRAFLQQQEDDAAQAAAAVADQPLPADDGPTSARAAAALAAARAALGQPYVYGATGPGSFDCSGLMYWAWRHGGVSLPRTSQEQAFAGRRVPLSEARPGDIVVYYRDMHHVGMYAGNGMIIHAPYPGARVRYESVNDMPVVAVVRP
ncbi:Cell wall-associated hydrolase, NlpC family [Streptacidiphilus jiangxiensis]|uniref:Cell wall-associated hydrolase, NlpC family n=1 Tax=Streptacidiphilus jiangxiensis TaxID=235985 RepID=A0A1H7ST70_STRJI|nr:Cell wall-associated hydrolase, NlpC family [Streptacidiphilus jiangxiensis]